MYRLDWDNMYRLDGNNMYRLDGIIYIDWMG